MGQKAQSLVEFALIVPLFLLFATGVIYNGLAYAEYLQYNNVARTVARDIAVAKSAEARKAIVTDLATLDEDTRERYAIPNKFYQPTITVEFEPNDNGSTDNDAKYVTIKISLEQAAEDKIDVLVGMKPISYTMRLESTAST
ncbi:MAG: pilus assembly protein [Selenomonadaceae bacterium]|nr:pilus assembly protein [Selenomonadaceae bacterium]